MSLGNYKRILKESTKGILAALSLYGFISLNVAATNLYANHWYLLFCYHAVLATLIVVALKYTLKLWSKTRRYLAPASVLEESDLNTPSTKRSIFAKFFNFIDDTGMDLLNAIYNIVLPIALVINVMNTVGFLWSIIPGTSFAYTASSLDIVGNSGWFTELLLHVFPAILITIESWSVSATESRIQKRFSIAYFLLYIFLISLANVTLKKYPYSFLVDSNTFGLPLGFFFFFIVGKLLLSIYFNYNDLKTFVKGLNLKITIFFLISSILIANEYFMFQTYFTLLTLGAAFSLYVFYLYILKQKIYKAFSIKQYALFLTIASLPFWVPYFVLASTVPEVIIPI